MAAKHGTPWRFDTHVPILFAGAGLKPALVYREISTVDIAPTLAAFIGINAPSASGGEVLPEVMEAAVGRSAEIR